MSSTAKGLSQRHWHDAAASGYRGRKRAILGSSIVMQRLDHHTGHQLAYGKDKYVVKKPYLSSIFSGYF